MIEPHANTSVEYDGKIYPADETTMRPIAQDAEGNWFFVDKPKGPEQTTAMAPVINIEEVPARRLRRDVMAVYAELGGAEYLLSVAKHDPDLFHKLLLKIIPQAVEADVKMEAVGNKDVAAMTTAELKMLVMQKMATDDKNVVDVENEHISQEPESTTRSRN